MIALALSAVLDLVIGDPESMPHPIRLIGRLISALEKKLYAQGSRHLRMRGAVLCITVVLLTGGISAAMLIAAYSLDPRLGVALDAIMGFYTLAARSLSDESMRVYGALSHEGIAEARIAVSRIVGRDTERLDEAGVIRAAVETVAENTSDGVIAPLFYGFLGGSAAAMVYKAINTMDSMIGYRNEKYEDFGHAAAKLDDIVNLIPARLAAICMLAASAVCGSAYSAKRAFRIYRRDRYNHKSPNSGQTESVCAGALGVRLAGDAYYFGQLVKKPYIGDDGRRIEAYDIKRAIRLMYIGSSLCFILCELALAALWMVMG